MNKLHLMSFFCFFLLAISCKSQDFIGESVNVVPIIECFVKYKNEKTLIDNKKNILVVGANEIVQGRSNNLSLSFYFINPQLLINFNYSKVYTIQGYKMIIDESLNRKDILHKVFKNMEVEYENFNLAKIPFSYNTDYWNIIFDSKNNIIEIFPEEKAKVIKSILEKQNLKFSKNYMD